MNAKIIDRRGIKLSDMKPGSIAVGCVPVGGVNPYRPIYARAYTDLKLVQETPRSMFIELTNMGNQYMDAIVSQNPWVVLLEDGQIVELNGASK